MRTKRMNRRRQPRRRQALTLIELVMVLVILAALAALIVPQLDYLRRTSDKTTGAFGITQVIENVSLYRTVQGNYPNQFDSLLLDDSASGTPSAVYSAVAMAGKLTMVSLDAGSQEHQSLAKIGISTLMDHDPDGANVYRGLPTNSGVVERLVSDGAPVAVITDANIAASIYPDEVNAGAFDATTGKVTLDANTTARLVAFGVGPNCTAVGKTMTNAPSYRGVNGLTDYSRFIVVFAVFNRTSGAGTKRAQLKAALDTAGDFLNQEINEIDENDLQ